jgi:hypothetical protein
MDTWQELERLAARTSELRARLSRAIEYRDGTEISRVRSEMAIAAKRREVVLARLGGEIDADAHKWR